MCYCVEFLDSNDHKLAKATNPPSVIKWDFFRQYFKQEEVSLNKIAPGLNTTFNKHSFRSVSYEKLACCVIEMLKFEKMYNWDCGNNFFEIMTKRHALGYVNMLAIIMFFYQVKTFWYSSLKYIRGEFNFFDGCTTGRCRL